MPPSTILCRRYDTSEAVQLELQDGHINAIQPTDAAPDGLPWLAPGFFDIQMNGYGGQAFADADATPEKVVQVLEAMFPCGVTRLCPTLTTDSFEVLAAGLRAIDEACRQHEWVGRMVPAVHVEGPYISAEDGPRGAHPREHVRAPDWDEFCQLQDAAGGRIGLLTMAPETAGGIEFIRRVAGTGVKVAIGHTAAEPEVISAAVEAGATLSTHLGNGAHGSIRRHPNYIWQQMAEDGLWASIICDGHHLPPAVVKCMVRAKEPERIILVSDAVSLAGLPPGRYKCGGVDVEMLDDGRIVVAEQPQLLAGATLLMDTCIANVQTFAGVSLRSAVEMATVHPARFFGLPEPRLAAGEPADLVLFRSGEGPIVVGQTVLGGQVRWQR